ncbi:MAG: hypothetical protein JWO57_3087 [Pseudonocardiales bacterium]|nr:hypothetical protein [Pseudonocardiales bacterium]
MSDEQAGAGAAVTQQRQPMVVGLLTAPGLAQQVAEQLAVQLPPLLSRRHPEFDWHVVVEADPFVGTPGLGVDLVRAARERMQQEHWQLAVCLTDLPLHAGRRPVTAQASVVLGVGLVSVPALGAVELDERTLQATLRVLDSLLSPDGARPRRPRSAGRRYSLPTAPRQQLKAAASPLGRVDIPDDTTVRYVAAPGAGTARLLLGLVRSNRPWRFITGLSHALVAALGTGAFGLTSPAIWRVADAMSWPRLALVAVGSLVAISLTLIVAHDLWERTAPLSLHNPVSLINIATASTVVLGVLTLFAALLVITAVCAVALIPGSDLATELQHSVPITDYVRIAWVVSSLATIGGALGAAVESNLAVREAAYGLRPADRDEAAKSGR